MADKKIQCEVCGRYYKSITQTHLDNCSPGMSLEEYRANLGPTSPKGLSGALVRKEAGPIAQAVVEHIQNDPELMNDIATRVGNTLFSDNSRGKLLGTAIMMLKERSSSYHKMLERLQKVDAELFRPERLEAGGPFGTPTPTETLIQIARYQSSKVRDAEDTLMRLIKAAIDDRKAHGVTVNLQQNFTGKHEQVSVPPTLNSKQRESLRRLGSRLVRQPKTIRALIDKAKDNEEEVEDAEYTDT